jgi:hypothetical protein
MIKIEVVGGQLTEGGGYRADSAVKSEKPEGVRSPVHEPGTMTSFALRASSQKQYCNLR